MVYGMGLIWELVIHTNGGLRKNLCAEPPRIRRRCGIFDLSPILRFHYGDEALVIAKIPPGNLDCAFLISLQ